MKIIINIRLCLLVKFSTTKKKETRKKNPDTTNICVCAAATPTAKLPLFMFHASFFFLPFHFFGRHEVSSAFIVSIDLQH